MYKIILLLIFNLNLSLALFRQLRIKQCQNTCPICVQCDTKRGTCSLPTTGAICTINNLNGICSSTGICEVQNNIPSVPLKKCQKYDCPVGGTCSVFYLNDGTDCTYPGNGIHSFCINNGCKAVIEALPKTLPAYNIGCLGLPDGVLCDTNLNLFDGEICQNEVCKFPNGQYNGILPL